MGLFRKSSTGVEIDIHRFLELEKKVSLIEHNLEVLRTNMNSLRGLINRKLNKPTDEEEELDEQTLKYKDFL